MTIDPRLAERRREVAEDHAHRNVRRLLRFLAVVLASGGLVWFALSPWMSVSRVRVAGVVSSQTAAILVEHDVVPGRPLVLIGAGEVEEAIEADPWVMVAEVELDWPNDVIVRVEERVPAAWVETSGGWSRRAGDGEAVPSGVEPDNSLGWVRLPTINDDEASDSDLVLGCIEFVVALPPEIAKATAVRLDSGELWAVVAGYQVRLGRATEMREKAISLVSLMAEDIPRTSTLILVAPTHPAVSPAGGEGTGSEAGGSDQDSEESEEP
ncbi:MAG: FtsQ-type POTRA domain-containing protein [Acidimicrobiia bacterium]